MSKKLVLITPFFFNYHHRITNEFRNNGYKVLLFQEVFRGNIFFILKNISPKLGKKLARYHENSMLRKIKGSEIKDVIIIRGRFLSEEFLASLKRIDCSILQYQWDSIVNNPNALTISNYTYKNLSFDYKDCQNYPDFNYLPLFHRQERKGNGKIKYNLSFVGSFHLERYNRLLAYKAYCLSHGINYKFKIYLNAFVFIKLIHRINFKHLDLLTFVKYSDKKIQGLVNDSIAVLDLHSPTQTGTTMRVIESLNAGIDVVTSNIYTSEDFNGQMFEFANEKFYLISADKLDKSKLLSLSDWTGKVLSHIR